MAVLVTGATGAIGFAIANGIALMPGFEVVLLCRNDAKAKLVVGAIQIEMQFATNVHGAEFSNGRS
jgi:NAD(P)-dependent dehydrogenase (short-subunit alcohol dehydrogenase family)